MRKKNYKTTNYIYLNILNKNTHTFVVGSRVDWNVYLLLGSYNHYFLFLDVQRQAHSHRMLKFMSSTALNRRKNNLINITFLSTFLNNGKIGFKNRGPVRFLGI